MQKFKDKKVEGSSSSLDALRSEFEHEQQKEISYQAQEVDLTPTTRRIKLRVGQQCGCGGGWTEIEREVPYDSPLQENDIVEEFEEEDYVL